MAVPGCRLRPCLALREAAKKLFFLLDSPQREGGGKGLSTKEKELFSMFFSSKFLAVSGYSKTEKKLFCPLSQGDSVKTLQRGRNIFEWISLVFTSILLSLFYCRAIMIKGPESRKQDRTQPNFTLFGLCLIRLKKKNNFKTRLKYHTNNKAFAAHPIELFNYIN